MWCADPTADPPGTAYRVAARDDRGMADNGATDGPVTGLRAITFNVLNGHHADGARRAEVIREGMDALRPDVVALQEVTHTEDHEQARDLLGDGFFIAEHPGAGPDGVGACLASRWPLGEVQAVDLHVTERTGGLSWAGAVLAWVLAPEPLGPLLVVHHKPNWEYDLEYERERQAVITARAVEQLVSTHPRPAVLLGDFDATPEQASIRFLTGRQSLGGTSVCYRDAWEDAHPDDAGHTFTPENPLVRAGDMPLDPGRRIDYVMVRGGARGPGLEVAGCARAFDAPVGGVWASDHFAVVAELRVPDRRLDTGS